MTEPQRSRTIPRILRTAIAICAILAILVGIRMLLEPRESPSPVVDQSAAMRARVAQAAAASQVEYERMVADLATAEIVLVGEEHRYRETTAYLNRLLDSLEGRRIALLLELPEELQPAVDTYVSRGASPEFASAVREGAALPLEGILTWAHANRGRVAMVRAFDENQSTIFLNRALLHETRNATMANAILAARKQHPDALVVAYGGQLHMTLAGRYRYDLPNRTPAGALLLRAGVDRARIRSVMLSGKGKSVMCDLTPAGILATALPVGDTPFPWFIEYPLFGVSTARELFDYWVNLGDLTR